MPWRDDRTRRRLGVSHRRVMNTTLSINLLNSFTGKGEKIVMILEDTRTVRELALEIPGATRIFERLRIDYCCGGAKSLADACAARSLSTQEVMQRLEESVKIDSPTTESTDFSRLTLAELINHIIEKH